jgi:hypothetical protein
MDVDVSDSILRLKQCPACSYDLRGLFDSERCPECGAILDLNLIDLPVWTQRSKRFRNLTALATGVVIVAVVLGWYFLKIRMSCFVFVFLCYGGAMIMNLFRMVQIQRAQPNAVLLFGERELSFVERGKTLFTIAYEHLVITNRKPGSKRWRFKVTDRRWFKSDHQFECIAFISPAERELLLRVINRRHGD